jgi:DnaJ-class molecular chaperone
MNDINTAGNGLTINGDLERQTLNSGGSDAQTQREQKATSPLAGASVCQHCDGTGWTSRAVKGLTRCQGVGFPHGKARIRQPDLQTTPSRAAS